MPRYVCFARTLAIVLAVSCTNGCGVRSANESSAAVAAATLPAAAPHTFGAAGDAALATLEATLYAAPGHWNMCVPDTCSSATRDWGADALTYALYLRWETHGDASIAPLMHALGASAPDYDRCASAACLNWSDVPMWDSIALSREFSVTHEAALGRKAEHAFALVDDAGAFAQGACPAIDYQHPAGGSTRLKTLETDSNYIKAALLLAQSTGDERYIERARTKYAAVRRYFFDPALALYTTYVFDDGLHCAQLPHRFFASVNGNMIDNGLMLATATGDSRYRREALATAHAVGRELGDGDGIFANLQADNDVGEPLIEAMYHLAVGQNDTPARRWLLRNAAVAQAAPSGAYERFFGGPAPTAAVSAWSANGGIALAIAAGALEPHGVRASPDIWRAARFVADPRSTVPATIAFTGRAIALVGTIGERCCEAGHIRVFIDGRETVDNTGIWQNKSPGSHPLPDSVLLSWRWPARGAHTIALRAGEFNPKEGGSFIHLRGYEVAP